MAYYIDNDIIHICESIFYPHFMTRMKLYFSLLKTSPQVLLGLKILKNYFFKIFDRKNMTILLLQHAEFDNGWAMAMGWAYLKKISI